MREPLTLITSLTSARADLKRLPPGSSRETRDFRRVLHRLSESSRSAAPAGSGDV